MSGASVWPSTTTGGLPDSLTCALGGSEAIMRPMRTSARSRGVSVGRARSEDSRGLRVRVLVAVAIPLEAEAYALTPGAVVAERIVALAHRLAEADVRGSLHEVEPLLRVASHAVEDRAELAACRNAHRIGGLVAERLEHDQLVGGQPRHPARERHSPLFQLLVRHH